MAKAVTERPAGSPLGKGAPLGNSNARKGSKIRNLLEQVADEYIANTGPDADTQATERRIRKVLRKLFDKAEEGDLTAINMVLDRLIGKPAQSIEVGDSEGNPLAAGIAVTFVTANPAPLVIEGAS